MAESTKDSAQTVQWGGVVAGAAVAAGAVLVFPTILPDVASGLTDIGASITEALAVLVAPAAEASIASEPIITAEAAKTIAGATLMGGGMAYFAMSGGKKSADAMFDEATAAQEQDGFAAREDMKRMQALMMARMQAANPQHMAAFAGAQQVR